MKKEENFADKMHFYEKNAEIERSKDFIKNTPYRNHLKGEYAR